MLERLHKLTTEEYFSLPYASNSGIKEASKLMAGRDVGYDPGSRALIFGSALDALLTDPTLMDSLILEEGEKKLLFPMLRSVNNNNIFNVLLRPEDDTVPVKKRTRTTQAVWVESHLPIQFDGMEVTIPAKCKYDYWNQKLYFGGDLKTTEARDQANFESAAKWFGYNQQAAWYMDITQSDRFIIIGVSKWNFKTFMITFKRDDEGYLEGKRKYTQCASEWWKLYGARE